MKFHRIDTKCLIQILYNSEKNSNLISNLLRQYNSSVSEHMASVHLGTLIHLTLEDTIEY